MLIDNLEPLTTYTISVVAVNEAGLSSVSSSSITVTTPDSACVGDKCGDPEPNIAAIVIIVVIVVLVIIIGITVTLIILRDKKKKKEKNRRSSQPADPVQTDRPLNDNAMTVTSPRRE